MYLSVLYQIAALGSRVYLFVVPERNGFSAGRTTSNMTPRGKVQKVPLSRPRRMKLDFHTIETLS